MNLRGKLSYFLPLILEGERLGVDDDIDWKRRWRAWLSSSSYLHSLPLMEEVREGNGFMENPNSWKKEKVGDDGW